MLHFNSKAAYKVLESHGKQAAGVCGNPAVGIHQMAQPSTRPVIKPTPHLSTPKGWKAESA